MFQLPNIKKLDKKGNTFLPKANKKVNMLKSSF